MGDRTASQLSLFESPSNALRGMTTRAERYITDARELLYDTAEQYEFHTVVIIGYTEDNRTVVRNSALADTIQVIGALEVAKQTLWR
jgi:hypothetical protein